MTWTDSRDIGEALFARFGGLNPLSVRFTDLHRWVLEIKGFKGKPQESNEKLLEAIQMAWFDEWRDEYGTETPSWSG
jgi:molecular chaperone DnaK